MAQEQERQDSGLFIVSLEDIIEEIAKIIKDQHENETKIPVYMLGVSTVIGTN